ncbi:hypothetical protein R5R35_005197 [Gryllus longicercus]|uniref:Uncharacterized protein n=1 Tax=Gryllus longicercus TaxID=2509291 RepID=A0AAN9VY69_9ORTH
MSNNTNQLTLLHWNANSIERQLQIFVRFLHTHNIQKAFFIKTHLIPNEIFFLYNFKIYRFDRLDRAASGGVAIRMSLRLKHTLIHTTLSPSLELLTIIIQI